MDAPRARAVVSLWYADALLFVACVSSASAVALWLRQDANWDLQNYHFYDPWAWLNGRIFDWDLAAAQLQTFLNPLADVPFYLLVTAGLDPRVVTFWLALPTGIAAYFFIKIAVDVVCRPQGDGTRRRNGRFRSHRIHGCDGGRSAGAPRPTNG